MDLWEYRARWVTLAGRRYLMAPLNLKAKRAGAKGRIYTQYYISIPKPLALEILQGRGAPEPGESGVPLTCIAAKAPWHHLLDWTQVPTDDLPPRVEREIRALALDKPEEELVFIPATRRQLEQLGLNPDDPLTLEDVVKAVEMKLTAARSPTHG